MANLHAQLDCGALVRDAQLCAALLRALHMVLAEMWRRIQQPEGVARRQTDVSVPLPPHHPHPAAGPRAGGPLVSTAGILRSACFPVLLIGSPVNFSDCLIGCPITRHHAEHSDRSRTQTRGFSGELTE